MYLKLFLVGYSPRLWIIILTYLGSFPIKILPSGIPLLSIYLFLNIFWAFLTKSWNLVIPWKSSPYVPVVLSRQSFLSNVSSFEDWLSSLESFYEFDFSYPVKVFEPYFISRIDSSSLSASLSSVTILGLLLFSGSVRSSYFSLFEEFLLIWLRKDF